MKSNHNYDDGNDIDIDSNNNLTSNRFSDSDGASSNGHSLSHDPVLSDLFPNTGQRR